MTNKPLAGQLPGLAALDLFLHHQPLTPILHPLSGHRRPVFRFRPVSTLDVVKNDDIPVGECAFAYAMHKGVEPRLVKAVLGYHGFREVHPSSGEFNLLWFNGHIKPYDLQNLQEHHKVNHFPRSSELTRKDRLYVNIQRMQQLKGFRHFNIVPKTFLLPREFGEFQAEWASDKTQRWIAKPIASSQGRGIYLANHPNQIQLDEPLVLSQYISNPLLIDGYKFDLRLYVAVTGYDPLRIFLYDEGLVRFATVKFDTSGRNIKDSFMHLTNYSINKKSAHYVSCSDDSVEDFGNKWSFSALLQHLASNGEDVAGLTARIEAVVIKTILAGEQPINSAFRTHVPFPNLCFELYGFDVLIDADLVPWLVEVNLSPSMACDSPLDMKIKGHLMADFFSLGLISAIDPIKARQHRARKAVNPLATPSRRPHSSSVSPARLASASWSRTAAPRMAAALIAPPADSYAENLSTPQKSILRLAHDELESSRWGGFQRIFPAQQTWETYGAFIEDRNGHNKMLHQALYPGCR